MIKTILLSFFGLVIATIVYLYFHLGLSSAVAVTLEELGPFTFVYLDHRGPYHEIGPMIHEVEQWAEENHVDCRRTFGEFLDNPEGVDEDRLRSHVGCVLNQVPPNLPEKFKMETRPKSRYAVGRFPGSPSVGPYKVYPAIQTFIAEHRLKSGGPIVEFYQATGTQSEVLYLFSLQP